MKKPARIDELIPDAANRRRHPERNLAMIVEALQAVGPARSIVIDEQNVVLAGNGVASAAAEAGITKVRVIEATGDELIAVRRSGLTDDQKRALALYDNRTAELAEWNYDQLAADHAAGLSLQPYWTRAEQDVLLGTPTDPTWSGMPEFEQADATAFRTIKVHFATQQDVDAFAALVRQTITEKTRYLWFPEAERESPTVEYRAPE